jgi:hypothetical protein
MLSTLALEDREDRVEIRLRRLAQVWLKAFCTFRRQNNTTVIYI